jgi:hypothetical protein
LLVASVDVATILVPLVAAGIGAAAVAAVSRHLKRQELYVEAAQKINDYIDEASEALNEVDTGQEFDAERIEEASRAVGLARFHSRRLESDDVTGRLTVASSILHNILEEENYKGRFWAFRSIDDVMAAVVEFMVLPRLWPPRRQWRRLPPNCLPNDSSLYISITGLNPETNQVEWRALGKWVREREKEIRSKQLERKGRVAS